MWWVQESKNMVMVTLAKQPLDPRKERAPPVTEREAREARVMEQGLLEAHRETSRIRATTRLGGRVTVPVVIIKQRPLVTEQGALAMERAPLVTLLVVPRHQDIRQVLESNNGATVLVTLAKHPLGRRREQGPLVTELGTLTLELAVGLPGVCKEVSRHRDTMWVLEGHSTAGERKE